MSFKYNICVNSLFCILTVFTSYSSPNFSGTHTPNLHLHPLPQLHILVFCFYLLKESTQSSLSCLYIFRCGSLGDLLGGGRTLKEIRLFLPWDPSEVNRYSVPGGGQNAGCLDRLQTATTAADHECSGPVLFKRWFAPGLPNLM